MPSDWRAVPVSTMLLDWQSNIRMSQCCSTGCDSFWSPRLRQCISRWLVGFPDRSVCPVRCMDCSLSSNSSWVFARCWILWRVWLSRCRSWYMWACTQSWPIPRMTDSIPFSPSSTSVECWVDHTAEVFSTELCLFWAAYGLSKSVCHGASDPRSL